MLWTALAGHPLSMCASVSNPVTQEMALKIAQARVDLGSCLSDALAPEVKTAMATVLRGRESGSLGSCDFSPGLVQVLCICMTTCPLSRIKFFRCFSSRSLFSFVDTHLDTHPGTLLPKSCALVNTCLTNGLTLDQAPPSEVQVSFLMVVVDASQQTWSLPEICRRLQSSSDRN